MEEEVQQSLKTSTSRSKHHHRHTQHKGKRMRVHVNDLSHRSLLSRSQVAATGYKRKIRDLLSSNSNLARTLETVNMQAAYLEQRVLILENDYGSKKFAVTKLEDVMSKLQTIGAIFNEIVPELVDSINLLEPTLTREKQFNEVQRVVKELSMSTIIELSLTEEDALQSSHTNDEDDNNCHIDVLPAEDIQTQNVHLDNIVHENNSGQETPELPLLIAKTCSHIPKPIKTMKTTRKSNSLLKKTDQTADTDIPKIHTTPRVQGRSLSPARLSSISKRRSSRKSYASQEQFEFNVQDSLECNNMKVLGEKQRLSQVLKIQESSKGSTGESSHSKNCEPVILSNENSNSNSIAHTLPNSSQASLGNSPPFAHQTCSRSLNRKTYFVSGKRTSESSQSVLDPKDDQVCIATNITNRNVLSNKNNLKATGKLSDVPTIEDHQWNHPSNRKTFIVPKEKNETCKRYSLLEENPVQVNKDSSKRKTYVVKNAQESLNNEVPGSSSSINMQCNRKSYIVPKHNVGTNVQVDKAPNLSIPEPNSTDLIANENQNRLSITQDKQVLSGTMRANTLETFKTVTLHNTRNIQEEMQSPKLHKEIDLKGVSSHNLLNKTVFVHEDMEITECIPASLQKFTQPCEVVESLLPDNTTVQQAINNKNAQHKHDVSETTDSSLPVSIQNKRHPCKSNSESEDESPKDDLTETTVPEKILSCKTSIFGNKATNMKENLDQPLFQQSIPRKNIESDQEDLTESPETSLPRGKQIKRHPRKLISESEVESGIDKSAKDDMAEATTLEKSRSSQQSIPRKNIHSEHDDLTESPKFSRPIGKQKERRTCNLINDSEDESNIDKSDKCDLVEVAVPEKSRTCKPCVLSNEATTNRKQDINKRIDPAFSVDTDSEDSASTTTTKRQKKRSKKTLKKPKGTNSSNDGESKKKSKLKKRASNLSECGTIGDTPRDANTPNAELNSEKQVACKPRKSSKSKSHFPCNQSNVEGSKVKVDGIKEEPADEPCCNSEKENELAQVVQDGNASNKRRRRPVSYKLPSLSTKLRRDF